MQPLTSPVRGGDTAVAALVGLSVELMTPSLLPRPGLGRPRLFAHAGVAQAFPFQRNIAGEGDPGRFRLPPPPDGGGDSNLNVTTISGQGSRAFSELQSPVVSAGAGVAFAVDAFNRRFRVKPSFEYLRQIVELEGAVHRVVQLEDIDDNESFANFRRIGLSASKTVVHHGIGGGLELEADASRVGPLALTVFVRGRVYQLLGDLDETLTASNEFQESATWRYEPESLVWRGAAGLRFRFVGSSE